MLLCTADGATWLWRWIHWALQNDDEVDTTPPSFMLITVTQIWFPLKYSLPLFSFRQYSVTNESHGLARSLFRFIGVWLRLNFNINVSWYILSNNLYSLWIRFHHQRLPLIILVCGTACVGKSTLATQLAQRLNLPNVLQVCSSHWKQ